MYLPTLFQLANKYKDKFNTEITPRSDNLMREFNVLTDTTGPFLQT